MTTKCTRRSESSITWTKYRRSDRFPPLPAARRHRTPSRPASPQPAPVLDRLDTAIKHPVPGLGVRAAEQSGYFPDREEVLARMTPWEGGIPGGKPPIDVGLQEQRLALAVLFDGGDLGEKLILDVLRKAVGVGEFGASEEAVHVRLL